MIEAPQDPGSDATKQWATFVQYSCKKCKNVTEMQRTLTSIEPLVCCGYDMNRVATHRRLISIDFRSTPSAPYLTR